MIIFLKVGIDGYAPSFIHTQHLILVLYFGLLRKAISRVFEGEKEGSITEEEVKEIKGKRRRVGLMMKLTCIDHLLCAPC